MGNGSKQVEVPVSAVDRFAWFGSGGRPQHCRASNVSHLFASFPNRPVRKAFKYRGQLNFHGHYWFEKVQRHVWHESMAEYAVLMLLDHMLDVQAVAEQPFRIAFRDGLSHVPDYLLELPSGQWVVVDVHMDEFMTEADQERLDETQRVCDELGWQYLRFGSLAQVKIWNLEMLARYRHRMFEPSAQLRAEILRAVRRHRTFGQLRLALATNKPGERIPAITHLMWTRVILFDLDAPFDDSSVIHAADSGKD